MSPASTDGWLFEIAGRDFLFVVQRTPNAFNMKWQCQSCRCGQILRIAGARSDDEALTIARMAAYQHLRTTHPDVLIAFLPSENLR